MRNVRYIAICGCVFLLMACSSATEQPLLIEAPTTVAQPATPAPLGVELYIPMPTPLPALDIPEPSGEPRTELRIWLVNESGEPVTFSKAELLLSAWKEANTQPITTMGNFLQVILEQNPELRPEDLYPWYEYRLYFEADGYAPLQSRPMQFIGSRWLSEKTADSVLVDFSNDPAQEVVDGEVLDMQLTIREQQDRTLRFVDDHGRPEAGVMVTSYMYWSSSRCGFPDGARFLAKSVSDENGRVSIPDGDFEYSLWFSKDGYHLREWEGKERDFGFPMELRTFLPDQETSIELHELEKRQLEMTVSRNGTSASGEALIGQMVECGCMFCGGEIAATDADGKIVIKDFRPEEYDRIFFRNADGTEIVWESDPKDRLDEESLIYSVELNN